MSKRKIISIVFHWIVFWSIFFCLFQFIEPLFFTQKNAIARSVLHDVILSKDVNYDVFFIGSSHVSQAIFPALVDQVLPIHSANLQLPGASIRDSYFLLRKAVNSGKIPELVVLDSYSFVFNQARIIDPFDLYGRSKIIKDAVQFFPAEEHFINFSNVFFNHSIWMRDEFLGILWKKFLEYKIHQPSNNQLDNLWKDYYEFRRVYRPATASMAEFDQEEILPEEPFDEFNEFQLQRISDYCHSNGIKLIIIDIPALNTSTAPVDDMKEFAKDNGISFYEFDSIFRETYENRYGFFIAGGKNSHMNMNGAILFSANYIGPMLAEEMGWDYDAEAASEITQIVQTGLEVDGINEGVDLITFTLTPLHPDTPLIYDWKLKENKTVVIQEQIVANNSFSIHKDYWKRKEYEIEVQVSNPEKKDGGLFINIPLS